MVRTLCVISCLFISLTASAQEEELPAEETKKKTRFSIMAGAAAGNFSNDNSLFNDVYSNRSISRIYVAGIGSNDVFLIGKYREFNATGKSILVNIAEVGKADWKQKFYLLGLRLHSDEHPLYADVLYVMTRAEETITTSNIIVKELTTNYTTENRGAGFAIGISFDIIGPLGIFVEGEYTIMMKKGRNPSGSVDPELGGFCASAGARLEF